MGGIREVVPDMNWDSKTPCITTIRLTCWALLVRGRLAGFHFSQDWEPAFTGKYWLTYRIVTHHLALLSKNKNMIKENSLIQRSEFFHLLPCPVATEIEGLTKKVI